MVAWAAGAVTLDCGFLLHGARSHGVDAAVDGGIGRRRSPDLIAEGKLYVCLLRDVRERL